MDKIPPIHPGDILLEEFLQPMEISQYRLAKAINVSRKRISEIINGKRGLSIDTAFRLSRYFGVSVEFWTGLQLDFDIETALDKIGEKIANEVQPLTTADMGA